ncbi:MAG: FHA domain-containing protein [Bacteriovoracaceae bacterium]|nr:FHA domain-containing protein [Bacteriovoracaceae bacterium]
MYKLVAVGGKLRGTEIQLNEGENVLGRGMEVDHSIRVDGVSKRHMSITVNGDTCFVQDLGSSNGTFVNGKLVKNATVINGDKIAVPNVIFQVVYVKEKKVVVTKKVAKVGDADEAALEFKDTVPKDFIGRVKYFFKHKVMSVIYSFNEQYEWSVMLGILLFIFVCINIGLTIGPVLRDGKELLKNEIVARGGQYAEEVARFNRAALSRGDLNRLNTNFLENSAEDVKSYELFDLEGRIVRPVGKLNSYVEDAFSVKAWKQILGGGEASLRKTIYEVVGDGEIGIGKAILAYDTNTGKEEPVGIIAIRFKPRSWAAQAANQSGSYLEALIITCIVGVVFFGMVYYMTTRPLEIMRLQIEEVLRGKRKELEMPVLFDEIQPLKNTVNSILQRVREMQSEDGGDFAEIEEDGPYVRTLYEFMNGAQGPVIVLNSEKMIEHINPEGEDLTGMRESSAGGTSLLDSARDQGFAATVIDLCDQSANNEGTSQSEVYELTGKNYMIHVSSLIGKDNFAKAFYVTFVEDL